MKSPLLYCLLALCITAGAQPAFTLVNAQARNCVFDAKRNKLYATVSSLDAVYGNSLVQVNPLTAMVERSLVIGSNPTKLTLTRDTNFLYLAFDGISFIKRVNLNTFTIDQTIALGSGAPGSYVAGDIATFALSPDLFVVARKYPNQSPSFAGIAAYYRGAKLPGEITGFTGSTVIESQQDSLIVVGYNAESSNEDITLMRVDTVNGVTQLSQTLHLFMGTDIKMTGSLLYGDNGKVLDPFFSPPTFVGVCNLNDPSSSRVEPDPRSNKLYFATPWGDDLKLNIFQLQSYGQLKDTVYSAAIPSNGFFSPKITSFTRFGDAGLAIIIKGVNNFSSPNAEVDRFLLFNDPTYVGIREQQLNDASVLLYPNPASGKVSITLLSHQLMSVVLTDAVSHDLHTVVTSNEQVELPLSGYAPGLYFVRVQTKNGTLTKKLIVR